MADDRRQALLVLRAQAGDREALDELLHRFQEPLFGYLHRLTGDPELAKDALQEVFLLVWRKLRWLRQPELFRPWCYRIASRVAFRILRRERRWSRPMPPDVPLPERSAEPSLKESDLLEHLPGLLDRVSPASRAVLVLHYLQEMSLQEVADVLGLSLGTAKSRLAYGLASLRRMIPEQGCAEPMER